MYVINENAELNNDQINDLIRLLIMKDYRSEKEKSLLSALIRLQAEKTDIVCDGDSYRTVNEDAVLENMVQS